MRMLISMFAIFGQTIIPRYFANLLTVCYRVNWLNV